jgi:hypothetical protein
MIYLGSSFFFYILAEHLPKKELDEYWPITFLFDIIKNILMAVAIFLYSRQPEGQKLSKSPEPYLDMI